MLGFFLGATLLSLLVMSRESESEDGQAPLGPENKNVLNWGRPVATAGSAGRAGGFPESFRLESPTPAHDAWEEFDAKASVVR